METVAKRASMITVLEVLLLGVISFSASLYFPTFQRGNIVLILNKNVLFTLKIKCLHRKHDYNINANLQYIVTDQTTQALLQVNNKLLHINYPIIKPLLQTIAYFYFGYFQYILLLIFF